jgi:hypothetical protein
MSRSLLAAGHGLCVGLLLVSAPPTAAQPAPAKNGEDAELVKKVKESIDNAVTYLKKNQGRGGDWEAFVLDVLGGQKGGQTALATLALLNSGLTKEDPAVAKALAYLRELKPERTYVVALQTMALAEARDPRDRPLLQRNVDWLRDRAIYSDGKLTGWSYPMNQMADNSNTQYAVLGLYAAKAGGVKIDDELWKAIREFYTRTQRAEGTWAYAASGFDPSFTMTVSGACGLVIANMGLDVSPQKLNEATGVAEACGVYPENAALAKGLAWIANQFNFMQGKSYFYNFYGIERLGRLSGQRFIGTHDWYREGCKILVAAQEQDGSFLARSGARSKYIDTGWPVITTSFALLFLSKGRTPVLVSKFAWGNARKSRDSAAVLTELDAGGRPSALVSWDRKHNDCRNLVEFASREIFDGHPLTWQVYDPRLLDLSDPARIDAEIGTLLQSPVVYLNGHGAIPFITRKTDQALSVPEDILKRYVEEGGFLLAEACCGDKEFADSFEQLLGRLFPGSTLKPVPPEHPIWQTYPGVSPADFPDLKYLDRGCRTVAVFSPSPLAGYWEERRFMPADARSPKTRGEKAFCLARNVIAYATGLELPKPKLTRTILAPKAEAGIARSKFRAAQLRYVSDQSQQPPPAADALRNLMAYLGQNAKLDVALTSAVLAPGDDALSRFKFVYLHGRKPVSFTPDEADNLKANLQTGGLLLADAACNDFKSWRAFDASFRAAVEKMWGQKLVPIPIAGGDRADPFFKIAAEAGLNLRAARCRREKPDGSGPDPELRDVPVELEGIKIDGRWVVVYSKYDIGCAIEGHKSADCMGYDKESALRIGSAAVLYALKR